MSAPGAQELEKSKEIQADVFGAWPGEVDQKDSKEVDCGRESSG
ncbi:MAG TPA: hypothetical protein VMY43_00140 [Methanothrix sp.]|nr:hypothetical protein [Methanothrix sp.]